MLLQRTLPTSGVQSRPARKQRAAVFAPRGQVASSASIKAQSNSDHALESKRQHARDSLLWFRVPPKVYFKGGCMEVALAELRGIKRAFIVTDKALFDLEYADKVTRLLDDMGITPQIFYHVASDPNIATVNEGLRELKSFKPEAIIALGGGSPMDVAKAMWLMYEMPDTKFDQLVTLSGDARKRVHQSPQLGQRAQLICIPTTSGTGSEVTPFAVIRDEQGRKNMLADYALTPTVAIVDPQLVMALPPQLTAQGGMHTLSHAMESFVSVFASDYSRGLSKHVMTMALRYFARAYKNGTNDYHAREKMHNAATVAGMAFANTFLGLASCMANELASTHGVAIGLAHAAVLPVVMRYNAQNKAVREAYAAMADHMHLKGDGVDGKFEALMKWLKDMRATVDIPPTLKEIIGGSKEGAFMDSLDAMANSALEDAHAAANPVTPCNEDVKKLFLDAWAGRA